MEHKHGANPTHFFNTIIHKTVTQLHHKAYKNSPITCHPPSLAIHHVKPLYYDDAASQSQTEPDLSLPFLHLFHLQLHSIQTPKQTWNYLYSSIAHGWINPCKILAPTVRASQVPSPWVEISPRCTQ